MKQEGRLFACSFFLAAFIFALMYPEMFPVRHMSVFYADEVGDYFGMFALSNFFYQGGMQLWDRHDQMSIAYICLTNGLFKFISVIPALCYLLLAPFFTHQAELPFYVFGFLWPLGNIFLKAAGRFFRISGKSFRYFFMRFGFMLGLGTRVFI